MNENAWFIEIERRGDYVYAVFGGTFRWGNRGLKSLGSIMNALQWAEGRYRQELLKAKALLKDETMPESQRFWIGGIAR